MSGESISGMLLADLTSLDGMAVSDLETDAGMVLEASGAPYTIVGAGYGAVNGAVYPHETWFESADGRTALTRVEYFGWYISYDADNNGSFELVLYSAADGPVPPASGWSSAAPEYNPAPTIS